MSGYVVTLPIVDDVRILHLLECPARDVAERRIKAVCTCPPERFLDPWAEPIPEAGAGPAWRNGAAPLG